MNGGQGAGPPRAPESVLRNPARLEALHRLDLLDTAAEDVFDRYTRLVSKLLGAPVALVSLVDSDRQFFKSQLGLPEPTATVRQTPLTHSFCQFAVASGEPLVVADAREHPFLKASLAIADLGVVAYCGIPITTSEGHSIGSLCAIDSEPRAWTTEDVSTLEDVVTSLVTELELRETALRATTSIAMRAERLAGITHDLRTPLAGIVTASRLLQRSAARLGDEQRQSIYELIERQAIRLHEMTGDFLLGSRVDVGFRPEREPVDLRAVLERVREEFSLLHQDGRIELDVPDELVVRADHSGLRRVFVNLVDNALKHGRQQPVSVGVRLLGSQVSISVANDGEIPPDVLEHVFEPFVRGPTAAAGTGLGLHVVRRIVEAHGGSVSVTSEGGRTVFAVLLPA